jgi:hypothetical protein
MAGCGIIFSEKWKLEGPVSLVFEDDNLLFHIAVVFGDEDVIIAIAWLLTQHVSVLALFPV